ncbi:syntaxin-11-like [Oryzias latipes]|uniref:Syntaxin 11 n=1 Tax=Oryzias latipes TaxID=8090 RepID=H2MH88_ORYLA|nr:syntaxin-11-like [Oryzias latipes]
MRDMMERLQTIVEEEDDKDSGCFVPEYDVDKGPLTLEAVIFEKSNTMEEILHEASLIRKSIILLSLDVERLKNNNERYGTSVSRFSILKRDSDSIARKIQQQGDSVYKRIQALGDRANELEQTEGGNRAVSRIARIQYDTLAFALRSAMENYNSAEEKQREICKTRIQRQASIIGKDISDEQLNDLVNKGGEGWEELCQSLQPPGAQSCRTALNEIKTRHTELVNLEARLKDIHEMFLQMAVLVEEQGSLLNSIETHVGKTEEHIKNSDHKFKEALIHKKKNPCLTCCPCLPFWK